MVGWWVWLICFCLFDLGLMGLYWFTLGDCYFGCVWVLLVGYLLALVDCCDVVVLFIDFGVVAFYDLGFDLS